MNDDVDRTTSAEITALRCEGIQGFRGKFRALVCEQTTGNGFGAKLSHDFTRLTSKGRKAARDYYFYNE